MQLYVRSPKNPEKVMGPFGKTKLQELANNGKLHNGLEVSVDKKKWVSITKVNPPLLTTEQTGGPADKPKSQPPQSEKVNETLETDAAIDLTVVKKYVPSGLCGNPRLLVILSLFAFIPSCLLGIFGGFLGWSIGYGMLKSHFFSIGFIGTGIFCGQIAALMFYDSFITKMSHNRSQDMASVSQLISIASIHLPWFLFGKKFITPIVSLSGAFDLTSPNYFSSSHYSQVSGIHTTLIVFMLILDLIFIGFIYHGLKTRKIEDLGMGLMDIKPYCENCFSWLRKTHKRQYPVKDATVLELAKLGAADALRNLKTRKREKDFIDIALLTCDQQCCAFLEMKTVSKPKGGLGLDEDVTSTKIEGLLDERQSEIWKRVLSPNE